MEPLVQLLLGWFDLLLNINKEAIEAKVLKEFRCSWRYPCCSGNAKVVVAASDFLVALG